MGDKKRQSKSSKTAKQGPIDWPGCQIMLTIMPGPGARDMLEAVLAACEPAAVLIRPAPEHSLGAGEVKPLVDLVQQAGAAAILFEDARLARTLRADGVHFGPNHIEAPADLIADARAMVGQSANIGIDAGISRHRAMEAGEAGADYVAFGAVEGTLIAQQARNDLVAWWADIFEVPCVALDVATTADAAMCDKQGADFVALTLPASLTPERAAALAADVDGAITAYSPE